jgi:MFS family permease
VTGPATEPASLWRHRDFNLLWAGESVSAVGSQVTVLALPLVAVLLIGASPLEMGVLSAAAYLPYIAFALVVGVWIDRRTTLRPVMVVSDLVRAALVAVVPAAIAFGVVSMPVLVVVAFLVGALTLVFNVAYLPYLPRLVHRDLLVDANGRLQASQAIAWVLGMTLAGTIIQVLGAAVAMMLDAISYLFSAACLAAIRTKEVVTSSTRDESWMEDLRGGLLFVARRPLQRAVAGSAATLNFFGMAQSALVVLFATQSLGLDAAMIGLAFGVGSVGGILGAVFAPALARRLGVGRTTTLAMIGFPVSLAILPAAAFVPDGAPAATMIALAEFIGAMAVSLFDVMARTIVQADTPADVLGRTGGAMSFVTQSAKPLGAILGGLVAQVVGVETALWITAAGGLLVLPWALLTPLGREQIPTTATVAPG